MTPQQSLIEAIAFALIRCKRHFRTLAQSHDTDEARLAAARIIAEHIERAGFELRQRPPQRPWRTP